MTCLEVDREAVREQQRGALGDIVDDALVEPLLHHVGGQERDDRGTFDGIRGLLDGQPVGFGLRPACAARAQPDDDVEAAVLEIQGMGAALAAVAEDSDLSVGEAGAVYVSF